MTTYTAEEQAANREKWVDALLSGAFPQGKHRLRDANGRFCCLGVACEVAAGEGIIPPWNGIVYSDQNAVPPQDVLDWLGLSDKCGSTVERSIEYGDPDEDGDMSNASALTELNDEADWDFVQIGELIRAGGVQVEGGPR